MQARAPKKKRSKVSESIDNYFIQLWEENIKDLRGSTKNTEVYVRMAEAMVQAGIEYRAVDVKYKIQNLTTKYKHYKARMAIGRAPAEWPAYANVHRIISNMRINNVNDFLLESGDSSIAISSSSSTSVPPPLPSPTSPVSSLFATSLPPPLQLKNENSSLLTESINNDLKDTMESIDNSLKEAMEIINNNLYEAIEKQADFENQFLEMEKKKHEDLLALEKQKVESLQAVAQTNHKMVESIMHFFSTNNFSSNKEL